MGNKESHQMKKKLERNYIAVAGKIPSTQILVSHTIFQQKEPGLLGERSSFSNGAGNTQDEIEVSYSARK